MTPASDRTNYKKKEIASVANPAVMPVEGGLNTSASGIISFSNEEIDRVLKLADTSLETMLAKLDDPIFGYLKPRIEQIASCSTEEEIKKIILDAPMLVTDYLPFIQNAAHGLFTPLELLNLALTPQGTWERSKGFLRWLPILEDQISGETVEMLINTLLEKECDEDCPVYIEPLERLALFADNWKNRVTPEYRSELLKRIHEHDRDLSLFHQISFEEIPEDIRIDRQNKYLIDKFEDLGVTDKVIPVKRQNQYAGTCSHCQDLHWNTLMDKEEESFGKVGILRVDGEAVFSLKLWREPSMVALRSLRTPDGRLAVIRGGVYVPPKEIRQKFADFDHDNEVFRTLDLVEPIRILPLGWVDNVEFEWEEDQFKKYQGRLAFLADHFSAS